MKNRDKWRAFAASMVVCIGLATVGCNHKNGALQQPPAATQQQSPATYVAAIDRYLTEQIGSQYGKGEDMLPQGVAGEVVCIPCHTIVDVDEKDAGDIKVWGDFWVFNYRQVGDTLKCVSGGNHPGLIHVRQTGEQFEVTGFDQVEDGSRFLPSAKRIFGDRFDAFQRINSDEKARERTRAEAVAAFVKDHNIDAAMFQDYGWDPVKL